MKTKIELETEYPYPIGSVWGVLTDRGATRVKLEHGLFEGAGNWFLAKCILGPGWKRMLRKRVPEMLDLVKKGGLKLAADEGVEAEL